MAFAAACTTVTPAQAGTPCGPSGYAYAGVQASGTAAGVAAVLTALATPAVESGHVAGWVGLGGPGQGPGGTNEWIQVGLNSLPGTGNTLYYEVMRPGVGQTYGEVATVNTGRPVKIAVLETAAAPNAWRIWVDGKAVTPAIQLAGSHGALTPMAMGESWDGGRPACNRFSYRFERVSVAASPGGSWQAVHDAAVLQDPGYRVVRRAASSFDASAMRALPAPAKPAPAASASAPASSQPAQDKTSSRRTQGVSASPIAASAPLRKGLVPTPSLDAILGVTTQPAAPEPTAAEPVPEPAPAVTVTVAAPVAEPDGELAAGPADLGLGAAGSYLLPS